MKLEPIPSDSGPRTGLVTFGYHDPHLAHDYSEAFRPDELDAEHRLCLAILEDAILCATEPIRAYKTRYLALRQQRKIAAARRWIMDPKSDWIFSFTSICGYLELNPSATRKQIQSRYERGADNRPTPATSPAHEAKNFPGKIFRLNEPC